MKHIILATLLGLTLSFFNTQAQTENKKDRSLNLKKHLMILAPLKKTLTLLTSLNLQM
jgi:hypothetical protein